MTMRWTMAATLLALAGCSEHNFTKDQPGQEGTQDTGATPSNTQSSTTTGVPWSWGTGAGTGGTGSGTGQGQGSGTGSATGGSGTGSGTGGFGTPRDPTELVDMTRQPASFDVDVLWVVDNSCSMGDDQNALTTNFPSFVNYFENTQGLNYRLGVISTDMDSNSHQGRLREYQGQRWIDNNTPNKLAAFNSMALMGTSGSGDEAGRAAVDAAINTHVPGHNAGFLRNNATLAVITITDEDDSSAMYGVSIGSVVTTLDNLKPDPAMVTYSIIGGDVPNGCGTADPAQDYVDVMNQVGGVFESICQNNWAAMLQNLAASALGHRREFFLSEIPDPTTLEVEVVDSGASTWFDLGTDFTYDAARNSVTFISYLPAPQASVYVHYQPLFGAGW